MRKFLGTFAVAALSLGVQADAAPTFSLAGGNGTVALDGKGGFAFSAGGKTLAFAPFERTASASGAVPAV